MAQKNYVTITSGCMRLSAIVAQTLGLVNGWGRVGVYMINDHCYELEAGGLTRVENYRLKHPAMEAILTRLGRVPEVHKVAEGVVRLRRAEA